MTGLKKTKYLVTGGAGFIGTNFVKWLVNRPGSETETAGRRAGDAEVVVLDALTYAGNLANLTEEIAGGKVRFIHGSINDAELVDRIFRDEDPDFVVNFAAESHVDRSITGPLIFGETNIMGTMTLLEGARKAWLSDGPAPDGKRFLQISTDEVYGSLSREYDVPQTIALPEDIRRICAGRRDIPASYGPGFFTEDLGLAPRSPYSAAKASADMMTLAYHHTFGLPVLITRCSNNYGPWQFPEKLIPLVINNIVEGRPLPVYGRGLNVRDWLYVDDHCSAIETVLRDGRVGEVYNIGGFNEKQNIDIVREIIDIVAEMTGTAPRHDLITYVRDRAGHDLRYAIDPEKTVRELGWYPRTPFSEGIRLTVAWYLGHMDWVHSITSGAYRDYYHKMYDDR